MAILLVIAFAASAFKHRPCRLSVVCAYHLLPSEVVRCTKNLCLRSRMADGALCLSEKNKIDTRSAIIWELGAILVERCDLVCGVCFLFKTSSGDICCVIVYPCLGDASRWQKRRAREPRQTGIRQLYIRATSGVKRNRQALAHG